MGGYDDTGRAGGSLAVEEDRTGLLVIRAWIEKGSSEPLRAQLRLSTDVSAGFETTTTVSRPEEVIAAVQEWLATILGQSRAELVE